jgi:hypothetical protein
MVQIMYAPVNKWIKKFKNMRMFSSSIHLSTNDKISFFFVAE